MLFNYEESQISQTSSNSDNKQKQSQISQILIDRDQHWGIAPSNYGEISQLEEAIFVAEGGENDDHEKSVNILL